MPRMRTSWLLVFLVCCGADTKEPVSPVSTVTTASAGVPTASAPSASASTPPVAAAPDVATDAKMKEEATQRLVMIARDVVAAWEREQVLPNGKSGQQLCPSAKATPAAVDRTKRVATKDDDWMKEPGWNCLRFLPSEAHWFQYEMVKVDDNTVKVFARRHDLELELDVTRKPKQDWKIATAPIERPR